MSSLTIASPRTLPAEVQLPASKSISNRALICAALATHCAGNQNCAEATPQTHILPQNLSDCDDTNVMLRALRDVFGRCEVGFKPNTCEADSIRGAEQAPILIDIMAAGTAMRFLTAYFSVTSGTHIITGTERMRHRPIAPLVDALRGLGADIEYIEAEGYPPLKIRGQQLRGRHITLPGNVSSQYISALMLIAPALAEPLQLTLTGEIVSRPYIDLTMHLMRSYGAEVAWVSERQISVCGNYRPTSYTIESDWSAASYVYEMVALATDAPARVFMPHLYRDSAQGDKAVAQMFEPLGVATQYVEDGVVLTKTRATLNASAPYQLDFVQQPDLAQTLVVTCCLLQQPFRFVGLQSLRIKETDRISALVTELRKWGYQLTSVGDHCLEWLGERCVATDAPIDTYDDHRMAMSFAPACLVRSRVTINNPQVVSKSFPHYWERVFEC